MNIKEFFKSKSFICIAVLLCIALISGGLLAILNDLLYVSEEERTARAVKSIYNSDIDFEVYDLKNGFENEYGKIERVYLLADGNYLILSTGIDGYKGGSVSIWAVAQFKNDTFIGISTVSVESYDKQTLMSSFNSSYYSKYSQESSIIENGGLYSVTQGDNLEVNVQSGATYSSRAINNAVNCAISYIRETLQGGNYGE